jgi:hypothetical protein
MKRKIGVAFAALALAFAAGRVFSSSTGGETAGPHAQPREIAQKLADCIGGDKFDEFKTTMWDHCIDEAVVAPLGDQLALPYKRLCEGLGARTKVELLKEEAAGPSIARYSFAEFHTRGVIVWQFEFIKPAEAWKLHAYGFGPLRMDGVQAGDLLNPAGG